MGDRVLVSVIAAVLMSGRLKVTSYMDEGYVQQVIQESVHYAVQILNVIDPRGIVEEPKS